MAGDLGQNYRDFWQPDNSLGHTLLGKYVISVKAKLKSNVPKI